jgi:flagellar assembly factor FliW
MEKKENRLISSRLGQRLVNSERIINFPRGIIGFEKERDFTLLQVQDDSPFMVLQSLQRSDLGLIVTDPYCFLDKYQIRINDFEQGVLHAESVKELAVLVTVTIPPGEPEKASLNLSGPIVINIHKRLGIQVPQVETSQSSHFFISQTVDMS